MANFDDIFNSQPKEETEGQSFASFDKDEWAAQKKQERENAFALIDETAQHMTNDGELFQSYLDVQAHFDRYSVGNAIVERVENGIVYTVEGNSGDSCRQCQRAVGNYEILGYGVLIP